MVRMDQSEQDRQRAIFAAGIEVSKYTDYVTIDRLFDTLAALWDGGYQDCWLKVLAERVDEDRGKMPSRCETWHNNVDQCVLPDGHEGDHDHTGSMRWGS